MKRRLIMASVIVALSVASGLSAGQERKTIDKASPKLFIAKVAQVNDKTKEVIVTAKGGEKIMLNFSGAKTGACPAGRKAVAWPALPKAGDVLIARASGECEDCLATC